MEGVRAGTRKTWCAFRMPITNPLTLKMAAEGSIRRAREIVRASLAGSAAKPGARR